MAERLFNAYQVADLLGLTPDEVALSLQRGEIPFQRLPEGHIRISESNLNRFLRKQGVDIAALFDQVRRREPAQEPSRAPAREAAREPLREPVRESPAPQAAARPSRILPPGAADAQENRRDAHSMAGWVSKLYGQHVTDAPAAQSPPEGPAPEAPPAQTPTPESPDDVRPDAAAQVAQAILKDALARRAQAVLLELRGRELNLHLRIDGRLVAKDSFRARLPAALAPGVLEALRRLAGDDGQTACVRRAFRHHIQDRTLAMELWTCPTLAGRRMVIRLGESEPPAATLGELGLPRQDELALERIASARAGGMILLAGPQNSGLDRTLRALVGCARARSTDAAAVLDVRGGRFDGLCEIAAASDRFAAEMIHFLDPQGLDVLAVPELVDEPCARAAMAAAQGGTLVLAGLTCSGAEEAMAILSGLAGGWELCRSLRAILTQRTLGRLCSCKRAAAPPGRSLDLLGLTASEMDFPVYRPGGCSRCNQSGYDGQIAIFGLCNFDSTLRASMRRGQGAAVVRQLAALEPKSTLRHRAMEALRQGQTSLEELVAAGPLE